jgi:cobalt-precorrin 5A hydrolase/precorrin-3B C17-methyltransferase
MSAWPDRIAILALTEAGLRLAERLAAGLSGAEARDLRGTGAAGRIAESFASGEAVIGICAAGILIRAVAPLLADKRTEPPVLAVAEDGSAVVPLLGGHHGGNALARHLAEVLGITPAITTAGDLRLGVALDEPPPGWVLADPERAKAVAAALLAGAKVLIDGHAPWLDHLPEAAERCAKALKSPSPPQWGGEGVLPSRPGSSRTRCTRCRRDPRHDCAPGR